ncbi:hypothetical protein ANOM_011568 [Aspergillus nomiae NRRL 13137]|uniref:FAD-binding domain-containing protein n=1 Tax=Aspergillus nomiae NRRL (strain ATCC 15546 / NRRL 13137 / CBS 260.88 / M93) TaxID=1509407 RepID=A0A0L1IMY0_ASPN3|nr:uncharacterized protein ANOM_011568 [Aspergillus nomiae NRRL 13137]KNG80956.1 hypothetical protein ANOM_011568 [Aspergillus nomiae NRRL 13137]
MESSSFKVIIVGGGPVGLTAAHALCHAGIDFVVLEQRESVVLDQGASLVLAAHSLRVMHQFGLLDELMKVGCELQCHQSFTREGYRFCHSDTFSIMKKNHGSAPVAFHRAKLVEILYNRLPAKAKERYFLNKKLTGIESDEKGVSVICADGSTYRGSMILGADGTHSKTRRLMRSLAIAENPQRDWDEEKPFPAQYRCMWCSFPRPAEMGQFCETQSKDRSVMFITGQERGWIFLYEKLPVPTSERVVYTDQDIESFAQEFAEYPISGTLKVKDVYAKRLTAGMANLEEGILKYWSWGRIALAGDACHKYTPNAGRGLNNGIQDVVVLCNKLHGMLRSNSSCPIGVAHLHNVFEEYQKSREAPLRDDAKESLSISRMHAWANAFYYIMARYIMPCEIIRWFLFNFVAVRAMRKGCVLDYIPAREPLQGLVTWEHQMKSDFNEA